MDVHPFPGPEIASEPGERDGRAKTSGKYRDLQALAGVRQCKQRQIRSGDRFGRVTPERERISREPGIAIAELHEVNACFPGTAFARLPFQAKRVWRREKDL